MKTVHTPKLYECGMIGLGTMGRNLVYNICDHGYSAAGFDKDLSQVRLLEQNKGNYDLCGAYTIEEFTGMLKKPRMIFLLVPAGPIVDSVISSLKPLISKEDMIVDCGNSHFTDTNLRIKKLKKLKITFMGVGISGGESGARNGASIMPGGSKKGLQETGPAVSGYRCKSERRTLCNLSWTRFGRTLCKNGAQWH